MVTKVLKLFSGAGNERFTVACVDGSTFNRLVNNTQTRREFTIRLGCRGAVLDIFDVGIDAIKPAPKDKV